MIRNLLYLAFRNLGRHRIKTVITVFSVALSVGLYIIVDAFLLGTKINSQKNIVNYETGSSKIYTKQYFAKKDEMPMYENFGNWDKIVKKLDENGYNASPRSVFSGSLISTNREYPFTFIGIIPELENKVFLYHKYIEKGGEFIHNGQFEIVIGSKVAKKLKVKPGDVVKLTTIIDQKDQDGTIKHTNQVIELKITGIINSPNPKINGNIGFVPLDILQDEMGLLLGGKVTEICIRKKNAPENELPGSSEKKSVIKKILKDTLPDNLMVINWEEDVPDFVDTMKQDNISNRLIIILLFILSFIGIANTMLVAVLERTKEIGMLRAQGMDDIQIVQIFLYEAGLIGLIGSLFGILFAIVVNIYMVNNGIDFSKAFEGYDSGSYGYRVVAIFKSAWNYNVIILSGVFAAVLSGLTTILPTLRALKMSIVDAIRFE